MSSLQESLQKLNNMDLNELDLENVGSWPVPVKVILCAVVFGLVVFLGFHFHLNDLGDHLDREVSKENDLKQQFQTKAFLAANLGAYKAQMVEMEASFGALIKQLPSKTEVPGLIEDIDYTGLGSGLSINSINLQSEVRHEFYIELPIDISVRGNYHDLGTFISGVSSLPRIVTLHDFTIKSDKNTGALSMEIKARTYRYNDGGGA
ncbi:type 4a pilus biogenesis protein PilO [Parendozoicomonas haliclonae]|uniref:Pilus assembly protein, PilO n=1 Tax=Parendozoicomonas haliclonae TaxID=1960125 RepID=A0A1X7AEY4_9GAMM|nr:type 4a pilus biogenesis protein PilO [Parendozoicomonas haliclonae]SMA35944.1 Pilus assembly protein, PilO [Parendozoicomonas haliclonae]